MRLARESSWHDHDSLSLQAPGHGTYGIAQKLPGQIFQVITVSVVHLSTYQGDTGKDTHTIDTFNTLTGVTADTAKTVTCLHSRMRCSSCPGHVQESREPAGTRKERGARYTCGMEWSRKEQHIDFWTHQCSARLGQHWTLRLVVIN